MTPPAKPEYVSLEVCKAHREEDTDFAMLKRAMVSFIAACALGAVSWAFLNSTAVVRAQASINENTEHIKALERQVLNLPAVLRITIREELSRKDGE